MKGPTEREKNLNTTARDTPSESERAANASAVVAGEHELVAILTNYVRRTFRGELSPYRLQLITLAIAECSRLLNEGHWRSVEDQSSCRDLLATGLLRQQFEQSPN
jgi:hypothetical protein